MSPVDSQARTDNRMVHPLAALVVEALLIACLEESPTLAARSDELLRQRVRERWAASGPVGLQRAVERAWRLALLAIASAVDREGWLWPYSDADRPRVEMLIRDFDTTYLFPFAEGEGLVPQQRTELRQEVMHTCGQWLALGPLLTSDAGGWGVEGLDAILDLQVMASLSDQANEILANRAYRTGTVTLVCNLLFYRDLLPKVFRCFLYCIFVGRAELPSSSQVDSWAADQQQLVQQSALAYTQANDVWPLFAEIVARLNTLFEPLSSNLKTYLLNSSNSSQGMSLGWQNLQVTQLTTGLSSAQYVDQYAWDGLTQSLSQAFASTLAPYIAQVVRNYQDTQTPTIWNPPVSVTIQNITIHFKENSSLVAGKTAADRLPSEVCSSVDRTELLEAMEASFGESDFRKLCFQMGINMGTLSGPTLLDKMISLIEFVEHRGVYGELVKTIIISREHLVSRLLPQGVTAPSGGDSHV